MSQVRTAARRLSHMDSTSIHAFVLRAAARVRAGAPRKYCTRGKVRAFAFSFVILCIFLFGAFIFFVLLCVRPDCGLCFYRYKIVSHHSVRSGRAVYRTVISRTVPRTYG